MAWLGEHLLTQFPNRRRMSLLSKSKAKRFTVLFIDQKNDCVSQLAEFFTMDLYGDLYQAYSAGPEHDIIDCDMISMAYRHGEDLRNMVSKDFKDTEYLREDQSYDIVIYLDPKTYAEWVSKTPWQGKQMQYDLGSIRDYHYTDDVELDQAYVQLIEKVEAWVKEFMKDPAAVIARLG